MPTEIDSKAALGAIPARGYGADRRDQATRAVVTGNVAGVKGGGIWSVRCHGQSPLYRGIHIELALTLMQEGGAHSEL